VVTIRVPLAEQRDASYDILIGRGLFADMPALLRRHCPADAYALITDSNVEGLYAAPLAARLRGAEGSGGGLVVEVLAFPAGERHKTRDTWAAISDRMLAGRLGRDCAVIALGGGVVGDVAGFIASTYLRGVPYVQVPTSLLAMIDSSIGGKTGVDTPAGKNLIGAFHQPRLVIADLDALDTLPPAHLAAGMAEAVKHGAIADAAYFAFLDAERERIRRRDASTLERVVARSVEIKAQVVAGDEREAGRRAVLNFGHTIGHAVEAASRFEMLHGEAIAVGMAYEARLAERLGIAEPGTAARIAGALAGYGLPLELPGGAGGPGTDALLDAMRHDKKTRGGAIRFALPSRVGAMQGGEQLGWTVAASEELVRDILAGH
jgi:3-dehydroquinate synthase